MLVLDFLLIESKTHHLIGKSLYVGLKQDTFEVDNHTFETEEAVTSKLFDDELTETKRCCIN